MSITFVDPGTLPFVNFSASGTRGGSYLSSPLHSQSTLWGVPPQTSIWNGSLSVTANCPSEQSQSAAMPAYFFLQPATYNSSTNITYPPFFALATYNASLLNLFGPASYTGGNSTFEVVDPTNDIYITSAIQWQAESQTSTTGFGYYVEEWDFEVAANGSLIGSCTINTLQDDVNICGTLQFPLHFQDPLNCTGSLLPNFVRLYNVENSTIDATLSDTSGAVTIRGVTEDSVGIAMSFNGTFWANSTAFSQLGAQDEHAVGPATSTSVWLYKPTTTAGAKTSKPMNPNAATRVEVGRLVVLQGLCMTLSFVMWTAGLVP
jgi:hypothetical protein